MVSRPAQSPITVRGLITHTAGLGYVIVAKGPGVDFKDYVKKYTDDVIAEDAAPGAQLGLVEDLARGETNSDFEEVAFALKNPGDISPVVRTRFGYHIIQLDKRVPSQRVEFEKVKGQIGEELRNEFVARTQQDFIDKSRSQAIDANPPLIQSLRTRYLPGGQGAKAIGRFDPGVSASELDTKGKEAADATPN